MQLTCGSNTKEMNEERDEHDAVDGSQVRRACVADSTRANYQSCLNSIARWIRAQCSNDEQYFDSDGTINLTAFTPQLFEQFILARFNDPERPLKVSTLECYRSAVKHLFRLKRLPLPPEYGDGLVAFFSGLARIQASRDQSGGPRRSGKEPLPLSTYIALCESTWTTNDGGVSHLFLITQWNLMCRSKSVQTIHTSHLQTAVDCAGIVLYKTKTNQEGRGPKDPRHVHANPLVPQMCWITAHAVYLACNSDQGPGALFPGSSQKLRYGKALERAQADQHEARLYGTHSVRKGVATYTCSGSTAGPSILSVCTRCGWSLGDVQDRYMRYAEAGDQFLGRVVAGLPFDSSDFAVLPPHFENRDEFVRECVERTFPAMYLDHQLHEILHLCAASLVYHRHYLERVFSPNHALMGAYIFRSGAFTRLEAMVSTRESTKMRPTSLPPLTMLYKQHELTRASVEQVPARVIDGVSKVLEQKGIRTSCTGHDDIIDAAAS